MTDSVIDARAKNVDIAMTRGDDFSVTFTGNILGLPYAFTTDRDTMIFTVKRTPSDIEYLIKKNLNIVNGKFVLTLTQDDTSLLAMKKTYRHDLQWTHDLKKITVMIGRFTLGEESTIEEAI